MLTFHLTPVLASNALEFAIKKATPEGKTTMSALLVLSLFSWTIIITKARQLAIARKWAKKFFAAYDVHARSAGHQAQGRGVSRARPPTSFTSAAPMNWITT